MREGQLKIASIRKTLYLSNESPSIKTKGLAPIAHLEKNSVVMCVGPEVHEFFPVLTELGIGWILDFMMDDVQVMMNSRYLSLAKGELLFARFRSSIKSTRNPFVHCGVLQKGEPIILLDAFSGDSINPDSLREETGLALSARHGVVRVYYTDFC